MDKMEAHFGNEMGFFCAIYFKFRIVRDLFVLFLLIFSSTLNTFYLIEQPRKQDQ